MCPGKGYSLTFAIGISNLSSTTVDSTMGVSLGSTSVVSAMAPCGSGASTCNIYAGSAVAYRYYETVMVASDWSQELSFICVAGAPTIADIFLDSINAIQLAPCGYYVSTSLTNNARGSFSGSSYSGTGSQGVVFTTVARRRR